jgi:hypothetical protein
MTVRIFLGYRGREFQRGFTAFPRERGFLQALTNSEAVKFP